ncbi:MAG TPA: hypothetical protein VK614_04335 [Allosphingosinicella sp.]|nr:hypothetical protein [Allosphingosinicella sp.]
MIRRVLPFLIVLLAGCARSEDASLVPSGGNDSARTVETVRPERDDEEPALGEWRATLQDEQRAIEFGPRGAPPLFSIVCDARRGLMLQRHGLEPAGDLPVMLVSVGSETRRLAVTGGEGPIPMLRASLNGSDTLVAALARTTTPIAIRIGDSAPLILPASATIGVYIGECQTGALPASRGDANANAAAAANAADAGD